MRTEEQIHTLLTGLIAQVAADDAAVRYHWGTHHATRFGENAITQNLGGESEGLNLSVAFGKRQGSASTTMVTPDALRELVKRAEDNAKASPEDEEYMPPVGKQAYPETPPRYFSAIEELSPEVVADQVAMAISEAKRVGCSTGGLFEYGQGISAMADSRGMFVCDRGSSCDYSLTARKDDGSGAEAARNEDPGKIDVLSLVQRAIETAEATRNPEAIEPGDYTVVLEPSAVAAFLGFMFWEMDARETDEGSTVFAGKVGHRIASEKVNLSTRIDSPDLPSPCYGNDGLAARPMTWIRNGVLERLRHSRYWASNKGTTPDTGFHPLFMDGEDRSVDELVTMCGNGLLVKRLWYIRYVDEKELLLTGMTRDGLFRIEDGKVTHPVRNLRFNESPMVFLGNLTAMSRPERVHGMMLPAIMSEGFTFSSKTESV